MKRFETEINLSEIPNDNDGSEDEVKPWPCENWTTMDWLIGLAIVIYIGLGIFIAYVIYLLATGTFENCK